MGCTLIDVPARPGGTIVEFTTIRRNGANTSGFV
jgi:hypothetical protein